jgi:putative aldouronate transport system permease protein
MPIQRSADSKSAVILERRSRIKMLLYKYRYLYLIMAVIVGYYLLFHYLPIIMGILISLKDMKIGNTIMNAKFIGLENYKAIFNNPQITGTIKNTVWLSILRLFWGFWPPIVLAIFIFDIASAKYKRLCQTIVYIPHFFSWVVIYGIVFAFLSGNGLVNQMMIRLGIDTVPFMTSPEYFRTILIGSQIWKGVGWGTILYFAAMTGINPELFEAAKIDGAGPIRRILVVTLPAIAPVVIFNLIMSLGNILNNDFEQVLLFYNPTVYEVGDIIDTWVYRVGLGQRQYGIGAAVGLLKAIVGFVLILGSNTFSRRVVGRSLW